MSLQRFALYFLSISACAVTLFPYIMPTTPRPVLSYANPYNAPAHAPARLSFARKLLSRHRHLAPMTIASGD